MGFDRGLALEVLAQLVSVHGAPRYLRSDKWVRVRRRGDIPTLEWLCGADTNPARAEPLPPAVVQAEHVDGAAAPEDLRALAARCQRAVAENRLVRADGPHGALAIHDL